MPGRRGQRSIPIRPPSFMSKIGVLYESPEWSNLHLAQLLEAKGVEAELIDLREGFLFLADEPPLGLYINRVFPSAVMRGSAPSISLAQRYVLWLESKGKRVINPSQSSHYDYDKAATYIELSQIGILVPQTLVCGSMESLKEGAHALGFPLILKHNLGGRAYQTKIFQSQAEWEEELTRGVDFGADHLLLLQRYICPLGDYTLRAEVVGDELMCLLRRYVAAGGISSWSRGSRYEVVSYPEGEVVSLSLRVARETGMEMGGLDFIRDKEGQLYLLELNATSNFTPEYIDLLGFDPVERMAEYIIQEAKGQ